MSTDKIIVFLATWSCVSIAALIASAALPSMVVFGNDRVSGYMSAVFWSLPFTIVAMLSPNLLKRLDLKLKDERYSIIVSVVIISPIIWVVKKFAIFTGLGISNNVFVVLLSIVVASIAFYAFKYTSRYLDKIQ